MRTVGAEIRMTNGDWNNNETVRRMNESGESVVSKWKILCLFTKGEREVVHLCASTEQVEEILIGEEKLDRR